MQSITQRQLSLLQILCETNSPVAVRDLARELNTTERVVRYSLDQLSGWLATQDIVLDLVPRFGPVLRGEMRTKAQALLASHYEAKAQTGRYLSADERQGSIILDIVAGFAPASIEQWPDQLGVSRATLLRDLDVVGAWFTQHGTTLERHQRKGVVLLASEAEKRRLLVDFGVAKAGVA